MPAYSKTPVSAKLGLKANLRALFLQMPPAVRQALQPLPEGLTLVKALQPELPYIHYFAEKTADLQQQFPDLKAALAKNGTLWISWRKAKNHTDLTENIVRDIALHNGLVDVKVCAVDDLWSGLKLVYRLKDRAPAPRMNPRKRT